MNIFAISDLHLSSVNPKPMDIFGEAWANHWDKIKQSWRTLINKEDIVLIPGDISWAMTLDEALPDIMEISELPGTKIFVKGNHDYWWESPTKIKKILPEGMQIIQNDFIDTTNFCICGTRGWLLPGDERFKKSDDKIFRRELIRLDMSLSKASQFTDKPIIVMLHFPPFNEKSGMSELVDVMKKYNVKMCVYGHLHGESLKNVIEGCLCDIEFYMVSCDYLYFMPKKIY